MQVETIRQQLFVALAGYKQHVGEMPHVLRLCPSHHLAVRQSFSKSEDMATVEDQEACLLCGDWYEERSDG